MLEESKVSLDQYAEEDHFEETNSFDYMAINDIKFHNGHNESFEDVNIEDLSRLFDEANDLLRKDDDDQFSFG